jgi:nitric oxide reductase NorE protein
MRAARRHFDRMSSRMFALAIVCGLAFVFNKFLEYRDELSAGHTPTSNDFFTYFFVFTGIHLFHLLLGLVALVIMFRISRTPILDARDMRNLEAGASYWHLIDLLWIVLFALLYLLR